METTFLGWFANFLGSATYRSCRKYSEKLLNKFNIWCRIETESMFRICSEYTRNTIGAYTESTELTLFVFSVVLIVRNVFGF